MMELVGKDIKTTVINILRTFKKIPKSMSITTSRWELNQSLEAKV